MRRIRSSEPGGAVVMDAGTRRFGRNVTMTTRVQIAADLDIRKLIAMIREAIEAKLRTITPAPSEAGTKTTRAADAKAGRTQFRWRTMQDDRVRPEHRVREGRVFDWATPPPDGDPGQPFGCRCWAEVVDDVSRAKQYRITAVVGTATSAGCTIEFVPHFIERDRWEIIANEVIPPVVAKWLAQAVPSSGDGVGTPPTVNLAAIG